MSFMNALLADQSATTPNGFTPWEFEILLLRLISTRATHVTERDF
jgi:hypothetical protein